MAQIIIFFCPRTSFGHQCCVGNTFGSLAVGLELHALPLSKSAGTVQKEAMKMAGWEMNPSRWLVRKAINSCM